MANEIRTSNKVMENLLEIHILMSEMSSFIPIQMCIRNLDESLPGYKEFLRYTDTIVTVLKKFSETPLRNKESKDDQMEKG
jgi:hypothetical protein